MIKLSKLFLLFTVSIQCANAASSEYNSCEEVSQKVSSYLHDGNVRKYPAKALNTKYLDGTLGVLRNACDPLMDNNEIDLVKITTLMKAIEFRYVVEEEKVACRSGFHSMEELLWSNNNAERYKDAPAVLKELEKFVKFFRLED